MHELGHLAVLELGGSEVLRGADAFRVEHASQPLAAGKSFEIGGRFGVFGDKAGPIVSAKAMAGGTITGKDLWPLSEGIIAQERHRARNGDASRGLGQDFDPA